MRKIDIELLAKQNVVGVGKGYDRETGKPCWVVMVEVKMLKNQLLPQDIVPEEFEGRRTHVVQVGRLYADAGKRRKKLDLARSDKWRPAPGGVSIGHKDITAGTLACVVYDRATRDPLILSNNHVLANSNAGLAGDAILQPGPYDKGTADDKIAELLRFIPINFSTLPDDDCPLAAGAEVFLNFIAKKLGSTWRMYRTKVFSAENTVDAALAYPGDLEALAPGILEILGFTHMAREDKVQIGEMLTKSGRTTAVTTGQVLTIETTVIVSYGDNKTATFVDQIVTGPMCQGGDSGSLVLDDRGNAVALLFAGSNEIMICSPIHYAMEGLEFEFS